jgi:hypothetical protein
MRNKDTEVFEKAFNELDTDGFFRDFAAKANHLQMKTRANAKKGRKSLTRRREERRQAGGAQKQ